MFCISITNLAKIDDGPNISPTVVTIEPILTPSLRNVKFTPIYSKVGSEWGIRILFVLV